MSSLMTLGIGLRFYQLDRALGGGDENQYLLDYGDASIGTIATTYYFGGHHVFHTVLMRLMIMAFGDENAVAVRFPAFLSGVLCLWLIYRIALKLFDSIAVARLSLLIAAICPIHIYYSQTARGYSLLMFLSATTVYAALRLLEPSSRALWGTVLIVCAALSVYTMPTNVYFVFGLAGWVFLSHLLPFFKDEFHGSSVSNYRQSLQFLGFFLAMAALSYLLYLPLKDQVIAEAKNYHLEKVSEASHLATAMKIPPKTLTLIFPGPAAWFLPFLFAGIVWGNTVRRSHRLLPLCVFFLPLLVPLATGVGGYPRNYLYNLPILVIFLAAGIVKAGESLGRFADRKEARMAVGAAIVLVYSAFSLKTVFFKHYPSIQVPSGKLYKEQILKHSGPLDLVLISNSQYYLYARSVFKENLKNILLQNKVTGIRWISSDPRLTKKEPGGNDLQLLHGRFNPMHVDNKALVGGKNMAIPGLGNSNSLLEDDFESKANWKNISNSGEFSFLKDHKVFGNASLLIKGGRDKTILWAGVKDSVHIEKNSLVILAWTAHYFRPPRLIHSPVLIAQKKANGTKHQVLLQMEYLNDGMNIAFSENASGPSSFDWSAFLMGSMIPPGDYSFDIALQRPSGSWVAYDGIRLFLIELAENAQTPGMIETPVMN
ncbi:MAG: glycosyltransferase family 39 protein [Nitrospinae bacterium]|nr:glycosyltransferase family 39 protein [Nitrospinota bacterium]